ncbi:MAG TPA: hypothetical protein PK413_15515, partial [Thermoanaerobaculia bacterium]|nr:hypothetical protein [Thermoanaerobaculia bacterium]
DHPELVRGLVLVAGSIDPDLEVQRWYQKAARWPIVRALVPEDLALANDEIRPLNPEVQGVGARELFVMSDPNMKGKMEMEVETTVFEPPHHVTVKVGVPKGFTGSVDYLLTDLRGRTRIDYDGQFRYDHWFARLMEPLVTPQARKKVAEDLDRLVNLALKG